MVGVRGFEPPTTSTQNWCATRLRYTPLLSFFWKPTLIAHTIVINEVRLMQQVSFLYLFFAWLGGLGKEFF